MIYKIKIRPKAYEQIQNEFIILITKAENRGQIYK